MELLDVSPASLDALRLACIPSSNQTREETEELRNTGILWLISSGESSSQHVQLEDCSALEALARLRLVNCSAWLTALEELWPDPVKKLRQRQLLGRGIRLGVDYCPSSLRRLVVSYEFFLQQWCPPNGYSTASDEELTIPVRLTLSSIEFKGGPLLPNACMEACEAVETLRGRFKQRESRGGLVPLFRYVDVSVDLEQGLQVWAEEEVLRLFWRFAACGVRVLHHLDPNSPWMRMETGARLVPLVQDLLATTPARHQQKRDGFRAFDKVRVRLWSDPQLLDHIFSAVLASGSVREVAASSCFDNQDKTRAWQWLAVIFRQGIESFNLDCTGLAMDDVQVLEATLRAPNPLATLFPWTMIPMDGSEKAFVATASRFQVYPPGDDGTLTMNTNVSTSSLSYESPIGNLQVISVDGNWVSVLLPGWGRAWVARTNVTLSLTAMDRPPCDQKRCGPTRLSLTQLEADQAPLILALLLQIGESIKALSLSASFARHLPATVLDTVLLTCPNLEELTIESMALPTLSVFTRGFESGMLRVQRLHLKNITLQDAADSVHFFNSLADPNHPMARQLREFSCVVKGRGRYFSSMKMTILRVVKCNRELYEFQLDASTNRHWYTDTIFQEELDAHSIPRLSLRIKLAFLSVVFIHDFASKSRKTHANSVASRRRAIHALDRDVLTTIFELASRVPFVRVDIGDAA